MKVNGNPLNHGRLRSPQSSTNLNFRALFVLFSFLGDSFFFFFLPFFLSLRLEMIYTVMRLQGFAKLFKNSPEKMEFPVVDTFQFPIGNTKSKEKIAVVRVIPLLAYTLRNHNSERHMQPSVHCSTVYNSQDMEET